MGDRTIIAGSKDRSVKLYDFVKHVQIKNFFPSSCVLSLDRNYKTIYSGNMNGNISIFSTNSSYPIVNEKVFEDGNFKIL